ncbi:hypothetical protein V1511DRAFT_485877 [Dipodascopsis uninucleata]
MSLNTSNETDTASLSRSRESAIATFQQISRANGLSAVRHQQTVAATAPQCAIDFPSLRSVRSLPMLSTGPEIHEEQKASVWYASTVQDTQQDLFSDFVTCEFQSNFEAEFSNSLATESPDMSLNGLELDLDDNRLVFFDQNPVERTVPQHETANILPRDSPFKLDTITHGWVEGANCSLHKCCPTELESTIKPSSAILPVPLSSRCGSIDEKEVMCATEVAGSLSTTISTPQTAANEDSPLTVFSPESSATTPGAELDEYNILNYDKPKLNEGNELTECEKRKEIHSASEATISRKRSSDSLENNLEDPPPIKKFRVDVDYTSIYDLDSLYALREVRRSHNAIASVAVTIVTAVTLSVGWFFG